MALLFNIVSCRESAVQEMEQQYVAGAERNRMLDILKRLHESDASELAELEANESESEDEGHQEADPVLSAELLQKLSIMVRATSLYATQTLYAPYRSRLSLNRHQHHISMCCRAID